MKKILTLLTVFVLLLSLTACGLGGRPNSNDSIKESNKTEAHEKDKEVLSEALSKKEREEFYENYFKEDAQFAGTSFEAIAEGVKVSVLQTPNELLFGMTVGENVFELYRAADGKQYMHLKMSAEATEDEETDKWFLCEINEDSENQNLAGSMAEDVEDFSIDADEVVSAKYEKTENGIDYVKVVMKYDNEDAEDENEDEESTNEALGTEVIYGIDAETHKIISITMAEDDIETTVNFSNIEKIDVSIPNDIETATEEDVMGAYMAILFLSMANGLGG